MAAHQADLVQARSGHADAKALKSIAGLTPGDVTATLNSDLGGLTEVEASVRLKAYGPNVVTGEGQPSWIAELWGRLANPLNALLLVLASVSWLMADRRSALIIASMVLLSMVLGFVQEHRSNRAAAKLAAMIHTRASVLRRGTTPHPGTPNGPEGKPFVEVPLAQLVPGDLIRLSAGDMVPADLRLIHAKDLNINQSALTGESLPALKQAEAVGNTAGLEPLDLSNLCFMGSSVLSGIGLGIVIHTGPKTHFGALAASMAKTREISSFDKGIARFSWMMIWFILIMAPLVFLINGANKGDWVQALVFAMAVAVGLTPEMLPMIVTVNLARGALELSKHKMIVKRLNAIQNFGAMDILCTDKTGTLTQDRVIMKLHLDVTGQDDDTVLELAWLNSHFQTGLTNLLDKAVLEHRDLQQNLTGEEGYSKRDEVPFDFNRRRMSVIVDHPGSGSLLICKGAVEEVIGHCSHYRSGEKTLAIDPPALKAILAVAEGLNSDGFRVVAVATRTFDRAKGRYGADDETDLTVQGFIAFLDPPKETAGPAIADLAKVGVSVKILTGDNALVTRKVCLDVGLDPGRIVLGHEVEGLSDATLAELAQTTTVFAKVSPDQKARIIEALRQRDHVVGFLGDGINDGPALKAADVGLSVDTAVDIAKESADIILLEKNLGVLTVGVREGRRVFGNITKYIKMGASSNFGNMFSVVGASLFLPFLPILPIQILTNNLLYDVSQAAIPTDQVDDDYLASPRSWEIDNLLRFIMFIGPISSVFDYLTFGLLLTLFHAGQNPALFQTGWFVESLLTQTLIIHIIRTAKIPFLQSRASVALTATSLVVAAIGVSLPYTPIGAALSMVPLPALYWPVVITLLLSYATLTHLVKSAFIRRWGY